jgi:hypothetical protein
MPNYLSFARRTRVPGYIPGVTPVLSSTLNDQLIAFWRLEEADGGSRVDSYGSNHLSDYGSVAQIAGKIGNGADFSGSNYLYVGSNVLLTPGDTGFTIACWVKLDANDGNFGLVTKATGTDATSEYRLELLGSNYYRFITYRTGGGAGIINATNFGLPPTGAWQLVIAWHDAINDSIGIQVNNGTPNTVYESGGVRTTSTVFNLGALNSSIWLLDGKLDAVGFWNKVLSSDERTELYNGGDGKEYPF